LALGFAREADRAANAVEACESPKAESAPDFAAAIAALRSLNDPPVEVDAEVEMEAALAAAALLPDDTVTLNAVEAALVVPEVVSVAVKAYDLAAKSAVVKLQAPVLLAVVVPSGDEPPSEMVTVAPSTAVPFNVTESFELTLSLLIIGIDSRYSGLDQALVPAEVMSSAVIL
jgi:hypothetical protein